MCVSAEVWYLLLLPLTGLIQSSIPVKSKRQTHQLDVNIQQDYVTVRVTKTVSLTCQVNGLNGLDKIRLLHLKPFHQLSKETHDI